MDTMAQWLSKCTDYIIKDFAEQEDVRITQENVFVVWSCKTLQNKKALMSTNINGNSSYYEFTYNGDRHETYADKYKKDDHVIISD